jgi:hypothetical protein
MGMEIIVGNDPQNDFSGSFQSGVMLDAHLTYTPKQPAKSQHQKPGN